jgi:hypothetical protein
MDMERNVRISASAIAFLLAAACSPAGIVGTTPTRTPRPTITKTAALTSTPGPTATVDPASIPTALPMVTPSPGPAPDLEIFNVTIEKYSEVNTMFAAEMRNNTDEAMIFPSKENAVRLGFDLWFTYGAYNYMHRIKDVFVTPGNDIPAKRINCILYPQETGIIAFDIQQWCSGGDDCPIVEDYKLNESPPQMGYRLNNYEAFYHRWEEYAVLPKFKDDAWRGFYQDFHLPAENVVYEVKPSGNEKDEVDIIFNFDFSYSDSKYKYRGDIQAWIILSDKDDRIVNVLRKVDTLKAFCKFKIGEDCPTGWYPIRAAAGTSRDPYEGDGKTNWFFVPQAALTADDIQRLDHITMLIEFQSYGICDFSILS